MNQRAIGIVLSYGIIVAQAVLNFIYVPVLLSFIGPSEYGIYRLLGSFISYFAIMDFGLGTAITRFYTKYKALNDKKNEANILAVAVRAYGSISIIVFIVGLAVYFNLNYIFSDVFTVVEMQETKIIFMILLINIILTITTQIFSSVITAWERFSFLKGLNLLQIIIQPFFVIWMVYMFPYALSIVLIQTICNVILIVFRIYYCFSVLHIKIKYYYFNKTLLKSVGALASSTFFVFVTDQIFWQSNQIILGVLYGPNEVAVYAIAATIYMTYMPISTSISGIFLPYLTTLVARESSDKEINKIFINIGRYQYILLMLVFISFVFFGKEFIHYWIGNQYMNAYWIAIIIMAPFTIDLIQNVGLTLMQARNTYGFRAKIYFLAGIFSVLLAIPLGKIYGGIGCAIATGIAMFLSNGLIMNWFYNSYMNLNIFKFWQEIIKLCFCCLVCCPVAIFLNYLFTGNVIYLLLKIFIFISIYLMIMWKFGLKQDERRLIKGKINYVRQKINI